MKNGDKVKALVQIGLMKEPKWLRGTLVGESTVEIHGNRHLLGHGKIKLWRPLPHDETGCPKVKEFAATQWEELKETVRLAAEHFLLGDARVNEDEMTIEIEGVTLHPDHTEVVTIAEFRETPCWTASYWVSTYSRTEPPDADEVVCGHAFDPTQAARLLVDGILKNRADEYWQGVSDRKYAQYLED